MERYEKHEVVGEGTNGAVYRATCRATGRTVAIKKLWLGGPCGGAAAAAEREVALLQELGGTHVVQLLDVVRSHV
jgi:cyclin-dependent kinase 7